MRQTTNIFLYYDHFASLLPWIPPKNNFLSSPPSQGVPTLAKTRVIKRCNPKTNAVTKGRGLAMTTQKGEAKDRRPILTIDAIAGLDLHAQVTEDQGLLQKEVTK